MKPIPVKQLGAPFGSAFTTALRRTMRLPTESAGEIQVWGVGKAKDHFSEMLNRVRDGECQLVRRPHRPRSNAAGCPPLTVSEASCGRDDIEL